MLFHMAHIRRRGSRGRYCCCAASSDGCGGRGGGGLLVVVMAIRLVFGECGRMVEMGRLSGSHGLDGNGFGFLAITVTVKGT